MSDKELAEYLEITENNAREAAPSTAETGNVGEAPVARPRALSYGLELGGADRVRLRPYVQRMVLPSIRMAPTRTLGGKLSASFLVLVLASIAVTLTALFAVLSIGNEQKAATLHAARAVGIARLMADVERMTASKRGYFLDRDKASLERMQNAETSFASNLAELRMSFDSREAAAILDDTGDAGTAYIAALHRSIAGLSVNQGGDVTPLRHSTSALRKDLLSALRALSDFQQHQSRLAESLGGRATHRAIRMLAITASAALGMAIILMVILVRTFRALEMKQHESDMYVRQLRAANDDLDAFGGRIAHDLRNALAPAVFSAAALRRCKDEDATRARVLDQLEKAIGKALRLLDGLLAFSRAGSAIDSAARARVGAVMADVLDEVAVLAKDVDATVECRAEDVEVACGAELLHLVLANLVHNALKFLRGRPERGVFISASRDVEGACRITVEDTGPGIPENVADRIFEPFYRVPGVRVGGAGIGLATVRRIVEAHGGTVAVGRTAGNGASFTVRMPLAA